MEWILGTILVVAACVLGVHLAAQLRANGAVRDGTDLELGAAAPVRGARATPGVTSGLYGYVIAPYAVGSVTVPVRLVRPGAGERTYLQLWVYRTRSVDATVSVVNRFGHRLTLNPGYWLGHRVDISSLVAGRVARVRLVVSASSYSATPQLFLDKILELVAPVDLAPRVNPWLMGAWIVLVIAAVLQLWRRKLRRHWPLPPLLGLAAYLFWHSIEQATWTPLSAPAVALSSAIQSAKTIDLHHGLISGSFGNLSNLAVELGHVLSPLTGHGTAGTREASALMGLAALGALYAVGTRVAGRAGGFAAAGLALLAGPFRNAATSGEATTTLIFAGALLCLAIYGCLATTDRRAMTVMAGAGALGVLAYPSWLPGIVIAMGLLAAMRGTSGSRLRVLAIGLLTLTVLLLPNRASVADQHGGELFGDLSAQATLSRNVEFVGRGHGAPPTRASLAANPLGGHTIGMASYLFGQHSVTGVAGGILDGGAKALAAAGRQPDSDPAGVLAFGFVLLGVAYLLIVPRLRMLFLLPLLVSAPVLFYAHVGSEPAFAAGTPAWVGMLVGGSVLTYVILAALRPRIPVVSMPWPGPRRVRQRPGLNGAMAPEVPADSEHVPAATGSEQTARV